MKTLLVYYNVDGFAIQLKNHLEDAFDELSLEWTECYIEDLEKVSKAFTPTMTIHFHPNKRIYDYLEVIKETKGHKLLWDMESPYESDLVFDMAEYFYYIFTTDKNTAEALLEEYPNNHIKYVPHSCNPKVHKPESVSYEYRSDICFVGNAYKSRLKFFQDHAEEFKDKMVTLIGVGYRGLDGYQNQRVIHDHVSEAEMNRYINGSKLVLNIHRTNNDLDMANSRNIKPMHLNNRFYEVAAMGKTQLVENRDEMKDEIEKVTKQTPEEYSYKARLKEFYLPLLEK